MSNLRAESQQPQFVRRNRSNTAQSILRLTPVLPLKYGDFKVLNSWVHDTKDDAKVIFNQSWWLGVTEGYLLRVMGTNADDPDFAFLFAVPRDDERAKPQLQTHYVDRLLSLTGTAMIVVTPGTGYSQVPSDLLRPTTTRLLDQGFAIHLVSLAKPPLHQSPMFSFRSTEPKQEIGRREERRHALDPLWGVVEEDDEMKTFRWEPFWFSITFWDKQLDLPFRRDRQMFRFSELSKL
ncbi:hypothetical protein DXG01_014475 [Tephrocybe rancida]|nr:hypothetical protein DXG01_014475 [Tephrocybe rancida]